MEKWKQLSDMENLSYIQDEDFRPFKEIMKDEEFSISKRFFMFLGKGKTFIVKNIDWINLAIFLKENNLVFEKVSNKSLISFDAKTHDEIMKYMKNISK